MTNNKQQTAVKLYTEEQVNKKIEPQVKIECVDNKCDTTYIYVFNEEK